PSRGSSPISSCRPGSRPRRRRVPRSPSCARYSTSRSRRRRSCVRSWSSSTHRPRRSRKYSPRMTPDKRLVRPKISPTRLVLSWLVAAAALFIAAWIVPHVEVKTFLGALLVALIIGILNAAILPFVAAIRLPLTLVLGFLIVLILDALMLLAASAL